MSALERVMLAIAHNARERGAAEGASFIGLRERVVVRRLADKGYLAIKGDGLWNGHREYHAALTDAGLAALRASWGQR